ncbi:unnamed protein product [Lupinus luteus]|uniref:Uncharacterized protein n=1 Tax=Lupinus luteus TaxID=3873 RepID=A0AAV1YH56_LUPLU
MRYLVHNLSGENLPLKITDRFSGHDNGGTASHGTNFFCPATYAQFYLDQNPFPHNGGRLRVSKDSDVQSTGGNGHRSRHARSPKQDVEEIEAYRASFGFSADEVITTTVVPHNTWRFLTYLETHLLCCPSPLVLLAGKHTIRVSVALFGEKMIMASIRSHDAISVSVPMAESSSGFEVFKSASGNRSHIRWKHGISVDGNTRNIKYCQKAIT